MEVEDGCNAERRLEGGMLIDCGVAIVRPAGSNSRQEKIEGQIEAEV